MVFSSATFLFVFLPIVFAFYFIPFFRNDERKELTKKNIVLCLSSLVFYAWGEPVYIVLMLLSIVYNFNAGIDIEKNGNNPKVRKRIFVFAVLFNLLVLGFFKYSGFVVENINSIFSLNIKYEPLSLPVGISFYTFQVLSYVIDVYRKDCRAQKSILNFATYISMFPQLIAGPIVQYNDIEKSLSSREHNVRKFSAGTLFFIRGLGKKVIFANTIGAVYTNICAGGASSLKAVDAWFAILCYTLQIYFDFSGYSDMAVGLGKMFGFDFVHNFNFPYCAVSIKDFWSRWHISLSSWFRDYVYIPLGGNRKGTARTIFNIAAVWTLTGLWHGASWNFVAWGAFYGILLIAEKYVFNNVLEKIPRPLRRVITMLIVIIGWVFFSSETLSSAVGFLRSMFGANGFVSADTGYLLRNNIFPFAVMSLSALGFFKKLPTLKNVPLRLAFQAAGYIVVFILCIVFIVSSTYNPFLYFRF